MAVRAEQYLALANPTRRALIEALRAGPRTVAELAARMPVSRPAVSQHLKLLTDARLTLEQWDGNYHYYRLNPAALIDLRKDLDALWTDALAAFARHVEKRNREESA
jgi:DNA-binding transcriptional ArsR family regulator